ncbi:hypothetical protein GCM10014715_39090 [Streptomyces spiralis]|uniref:Uncharacterized protein n=1 Tax=Streptomyces spiralis TaxID=66376 RepID=A0A919A1K0_9ACTN|nr:hypothetical protein [Streptomyces spiralis]GHE79928.1 hypothetical protein GCM10014715_39090 [Streptomyces spiralis]
MTATAEASRRWLVVYTEQPHAMQITAVEPLPDDADAELRSELWVNCLSSYVVDAAGAREARRTARQLHDVDRIREVRARQRACRTLRRTHPAVAPHGPAAIETASQDLNLTHRCRAYASALAVAALTSGYRHRPFEQRDLTFQQYVAELPIALQATLHRYAVLDATGRNDEAVGLLVNTLAAHVSDL